MLYRRVVVERLHLENGLLPYLNPDSVLVMDNMKSHHGKAIKQLLEGAKARYIFLPPYSPEGAFAQIQSQNLGDPSRCDSACFSGGDTI